MTTTAKTDDGAVPVDKATTDKMSATKTTALVATKTSTPSPEERRDAKLEERRIARKKERDAQAAKLQASLRSYLYRGPVGALSLRGGPSVRLVPGAIVSLPAGVEHVQRLVARGHLVPTDASKKGAN
jgi:hypothetical protein